MVEELKGEEECRELLPVIVIPQNYPSMQAFKG
jgi:hypothetical protein